ncbi:MAG: glycosyltransferase family 39 protein [archaeon]
MSSKSDRHAWIERWSPALYIILYLLIFSFCALFIYQSYLLVTSSAYLNYTEGLSLSQVSIILDGHPLYQNINKEPWIYTTYPPLGPLIFALFSFIFGKGISTLRFAVVLAEVAIAIAFHLFLSYKTKDRLFSLAFSSFLLFTFVVHKFHALARIDFIYILLSTSTLLSFLWFLEKRNRKRMIWTIVLFTLAFMTKQTAVFLLLPFGLAVIFNWKRSKVRNSLIHFNVINGLVAGVVYLIANLITNFHLYTHTITYQAMSGWCWMTIGLFRCNKTFFPLIAFGLAALVLLRGNWPLRIFTAFVAVWSVSSFGKCGSDCNYFIEPMILFLLLLALAISGQVKERLRLPVLVLVGLVVGSQFLIGGFFHTPDTIDAIGKETAIIIDKISDSEGLIIAEEPFFAETAGKDYLLTDVFQLGLLGEKGVFDKQAVIDRIAEGDVEYIIMSWRIYQMGIVDIEYGPWDPVYSAPPVFDDGMAMIHVFRRRDGQ